jgi:signal transduction histidine kinase
MPKQQNWPAEALPSEYVMPTEMASSPAIPWEGVMISDLVETTKLKNEIDGILHQNQELAVVGQFAAAVMHEINGPLEAVTNLNYLIQCEAGDVERVRTYCLLIDEQLLTLTKISRQTLSFYKSSETKEAIAISTLAEAALRVHEKKIAAKQIRLRKRLPVDITAEVHAGDLLQVLSNLVANAVDALPMNGVLGLSVKRGEHEVYVTIADNGPGIPAPVLSKIFDPFFTTKKERGTGLGLAISKSLVEKHKGRIRSRSSTRPTRTGTTFRVSLPIAASSAASR